MRVEKIWPAAFLILALSCASSVPCGRPEPVQTDRPDISSDRLNAVDRTMRVSDIIHALGPAHMDMGSGLHLYRWFTTGGQMLTVSFSDSCEPPRMFKLEPCQRTPCARVNEGLGRN